MTIKMRPWGWELDGAWLPWLWGEINYWDIERAHWREVLRAYRQAGHRVCSASVLPRVHQVAGDEYDFGRLQPRLDLLAFLKTAQEADLKTVLWVGPRDTAGSAAAGYPEDWLRTEEILARDAQGKFILSQVCLGGDVFTLPCLLSSRLNSYLQSFFQACDKIISPALHPTGPIIGLGLTQAPGWGSSLSAFAADYHPEALAVYRQGLKKQYNHIDALNNAYGTNYAHFSDIEPPRSPGPSSALPSAGELDWARFREDYFVLAAERMHTLLFKPGIQNLPIFLATLPVSGRPGNLAELEHSRCFTYIMPEWPFLDAATDHPEACWRSIIPSARFLTSFRATLRMDINARAKEENFQWMHTIAFGMRGWDALSPCGAGARSGFITDRQGARIRPLPSFWETLQHISQSEGFLHSQYTYDMLLLRLPELERACYLRMPPTPRFDLLGQEMKIADFKTKNYDLVTSSYLEVLGKINTCLQQHQFAYAIADVDMDWKYLSRVPVLLVPSSEAMASSSQARLVQLLQAGCHVILIGALPPHPVNAEHPALKALAESQPKKSAPSRNNKIKSGYLLYQEQFSEAKLLKWCKQLGIQRFLTVDHPAINLTFHKFRNRIFVAAIHKGAESVEAYLSREGKFVLKDFWNANKFWGGNNEIRMTFPPRSIKFWELIIC